MEQVPDDGRLLLYADNMLLNYQSPFCLHRLPYKFYMQGWATQMPFNNTIVSSNLDLASEYFYFLLSTPKDTTQQVIDEKMTLLQKQLNEIYNQPSQIHIIDKNKEFELIQLKKL
ncbi:MAG: hypothetical protein IJS00_05715 [Paludibacteraceae bacterium]|nr:hypothetical protein [Paludibacteraceae bacterium]